MYWVAAMQAAIKAGRRDGSRTWRRKGRKLGTEASHGKRGMELSEFRHTQFVQTMLFGTESRRRQAEHRKAEGEVGGQSLAEQRKVTEQESSL